MRIVLAAILVLLLAGCGIAWKDDGNQISEKTDGQITGDTAPTRFRIVPDDYAVPYAGTAEDGRKFFLSEYLFSSKSSYVGLFLWKADGSFDEVRVTDVRGPDEVPPGQAAPADARAVVESRLAELGDYEIEPIEVEPFIEKVAGVKFGWHVGRYEDGTYFINVEPGDSIAYYAPWDGLEYDT